MKIRILLFAIIAILGNSFAQLNAQVYDDHDVEKLRKFINTSNMAYFFYINEKVPEGASREWVLKVKYVEWVVHNSTYRLKAIDCTYDNEQMHPLFGCEFDFEGCTQLEYISLPKYSDWELKLAGCTNLYKIDIKGGASLDLSGCSNLTDLRINKVIGSGNINLSGCSELKNANMIGDFNGIDLTNCHELESIYLSGNFSEIDLSDCRKLKNIYLSGKFNGVDLSQQTELTELRLNGELTNIDLENNKKLVLLSLTMRPNESHSLTFSDFPELRTLSVRASLSALTVKDCNNLSKLNCADNYLVFSDFPELQNLPNLTSSSFTYAPQAKIKNHSSYKPLDPIDLSHTGGTKFVWKYVAWLAGISPIEGTDYTVENGVTTFLKEQPDSVYCEITHPDFPDLTLRTTNTKITNAAQSIDTSTLSSQVEAYSAQVGEITLTAPVEAQYTVYNLMGEVVTRGLMKNLEETITVAPSSIHLIKVETQGETLSRKVMVK